VSETYDKKLVLAAANKTAQTMRAERRAMLDEWDAKSLFVRFLSGFCGVCRPLYHGVTQQKIAERISFKATFCTESTISLSDFEIDAIRDWWLIEETLPHE
jgi:hypothetical protein